MTHLDGLEAMVVAEGGGPEKARRHAQTCPRCAAEVAGCRELLGHLVEAGRLPAPPGRLLGWAKAFARTSATPRKTSILEVIAFGRQPLAAVRGAAGSGLAVLFGDADWQLDVRLEPVGAGTTVHGQIVPLSQPPGEPWEVAVVQADGTVRTTCSDRSGEFRIAGVETWRGLSVVAERGDLRLVAPRIDGAEDGSGE